MTNTVMIISEEAPARKRRMLTTTNSYYLKKIQDLANENLNFLKLLEEQETGKRIKLDQPSTSVHANNKNKNTVRTPGKGKAGGKKTKGSKTSVRPAVVVNEKTERMKEFIVNELKGTDLTLVIQKKLFKSDTKKVLNRLNMPVNQLETDGFLRADEKLMIVKDNGMEVRLLGPTLEMHKDPMNLRLWHMQSSDNYVLTTNWYRFRSKNKLHLKTLSNIQVWSFRGLDDHKLCFAVVCVEEPDGEVDDSDS